MCHSTRIRFCSWSLGIAHVCTRPTIFAKLLTHLESVGLPRLASPIHQDRAVKTLEEAVYFRQYKLVEDSLLSGVLVENGVNIELPILQKNKAKHGPRPSATGIYTRPRRFAITQRTAQAVHSCKPPPHLALDGERCCVRRSKRPNADRHCYSAHSKA